MIAAAAKVDSTKVSIPSMVDVLVQRLQTIITSGEVKPGERLIEERLAERFGVSRPPLREALRILERDGLVQSLVRRGYRVVPMTADDVREIYSLRFALERMALDLGIPVKDPAQLEPMRIALTDIERAVHASDDDAMLIANSNFHTALVALPGHSRLNAAYAALRLQLEFCMAYNLRLRERQYGNRADVPSRHAQLFESIEKGDKEAAMYEIEHHGNQTFLDNLDELLSHEGAP